MKTTISKLFAGAALAVVTFATGNAQTNLGASCGCPTPVSSRPTVLLSTLATNGGAGDGELIANNVILDCSKTWILDKKIYVAPGKTLTILPGTVIKGRDFPGAPANATALTVEVGGKIFASGTADCQIVFTTEADNLDGTYSVSNTGKWGGLLVAGKATNNLTLAANGPFTAGSGNGRLCVADGLGTFEGFSSSNSKDQFGVNLSTGGVFDDNDNSGILKYVSIRHAGTALSVGAEINSLTLGSVGRGTIIDHIEIVSAGDDGIEFFGGTVNVKYCSMLFGNDDNLDWDDGWQGKVQYIFVLQNQLGQGSPDNDNGFEADADDQKSNLLPRSHPVIYNATIIGNGKTALTSDNSALAGINAKELTEGEIYNSIIANFKTGFNMTKALGTRTGTSEAYHNWSNSLGNGSQSLKVKCNTFVGNVDGITVDKLSANVVPADNTQFTTTDLNNVVSSITGFNYAFAINGTTNAISQQVDAVPNPALSTTGCPVAPVDGFFNTANYRGAFQSNGQNWLSSWTYSTLLGAVNGLQPCPTDINGDGVTNNSDFLQLLGQFGLNCN